MAHLLVASLKGPDYRPTNLNNLQMAGFALLAERNG